MSNVLKIFKTKSLKSDCLIRAEFVRLASIRKITLNPTVNNLEKTMRDSTCSCPDYFSFSVCIHLITCLLKTGSYDEFIELKKPKRRGRKPKVNGALERDDS